MRRLRNAVTWPVIANELPADSECDVRGHAVDDGHYRVARDAEGGRVILLHVDASWKVDKTDVPKVVCAKCGAVVGQVHDDPGDPPWYLALDADGVTTREMRGRP